MKYHTLLGIAQKEFVREIYSEYINSCPNKMKNDYYFRLLISSGIIADFNNIISKPLFILHKSLIDIGTQDNIDNILLFIDHNYLLLQKY